MLSLVKEYIPQSYKRTLACLIQKGKVRETQPHHEQCEVNMHDRMRVCKYACNTMKVASSLGDDLRQNALGSPLFSDVIFEVEGRDVPCHKVVITSRCPQFQAMFLSGARSCLPCCCASCSRC